MSTILHFMPGSEAPATGLASALGIEGLPVSVRRFPDGESLVRVGGSGGTALLFCPLDHPDTKLVQVLLAASALRDSGAGQVILVAPYLGYMRQDMAFSPGEAVSQRVIGGLISGSFDGLVTVDPHLHRTARLEDVVPGIAALVVSAAATIAQAIAASVAPDTILVGPDAESRQWVEAVAAPLGLETMIGEKRRLGDRRVEIVLPEASRAAARPVMLVDDLISSGGTLRECARQLASAGAILRGAIATHCLADAAGLAILARDGIERVVATDTVPGPASIIAMAPALAAAIRQQDWFEHGGGMAGD